MSVFEEYLEVAKDLRAAGKEGHFRSAVSRAYYFAAHAARNRAFEIERGRLSIGTGKDFHGIWGLFDSAGSEEAADVFTIGEALRRRRVNADYYDKRPVGPKEAEDAIIKAEQIRALLPRVKSL